LGLLEILGQLALLSIVEPEGILISARIRSSIWAGGMLARRSASNLLRFGERLK
jgi:hypothetical protein